MYNVSYVQSEILGVGGWWRRGVSVPQAFTPLPGIYTHVIIILLLWMCKQSKLL